MWIRSIRRFISEAFAGIFKNGLMTIASVVVVTSCLIMLGVFLVVTLNVNYISESIADSCQVKAYVTDEAQKDTQKLKEIEASIRALKYTEDVQYENGVQRFKDIKKKMDENELASFEGLPDDVLPDAFNVTVNDIINTQKITEELKKIDGIKKVENGQDVVTMINNIRNTVKNFSIWIILAFMLISIFIISNTVKLTVHNRRKEINIMKYVGATDSYIRWPFIIEGIIVGLVSAGVAFAVTYSLYDALYNTVSNDASIVKFLKLLKFSEIWKVFALSYAGLGAVIGAIGSAFSIRKYLKV